MNTNSVCGPVNFTGVHTDTEVNLIGWMQISPYMPPLTDTDSHLLRSSPSLIEQPCRGALWGFLKPGRSALCIEHETDRPTDRQTGRLSPGDSKHISSTDPFPPIYTGCTANHFTSILTFAWRHIV